MSSSVTESEHREVVNWLSSNNRLTKAKKCSKLIQPESSNSGLLHFIELVCYQFIINIKKFFMVNVYNNKVIWSTVSHCRT